MARGLCLWWMGEGEIHYREASLYYFSSLDAFTYIQRTKQDLDADRSGHDVADYLRRLNRHAGHYHADELLMDAKYLRSRSWINLANPFFWYALCAHYKIYVWDGNSCMTFPLVHIGGIDYLPSLRMALTPFGPEYHVESFLRAGGTVLFVDMRIGDQTFHQSWGGAGLLIKNAYGKGRFSLDMSLDAWTQPAIEIGGDSISVESGGLGGAVSLRGHYDLSDSPSPVSAIVELGYKSAGFVEGYAFDSSAILMFGIGVRM
jgi:hypothetical protein